ncbi:MBL fold metallo-hydrolase [Breznakiella homolactica]|uniref:MBL fold metallo-hydrolase n=1 Tax=Breznakiella homolactica TaxID=2798577 RepID=A0A7T8BBC4_9SPIR|nr:MBL fold metallo-hydrolase [Breznakiella homolactica]QQO10412.1 MBL fold metallo-hydrolase [Breznakiella homolactica]
MVEQIPVGALATNCWLYPIPGVPEGRACAVIDPGDDAGSIISRIEQLNLSPRYILLTHGHFDHVGALSDLVRHYEPKPQIAIHRADAARLGPGSLRIHQADLREAGAVMLLEAFKEPPKADIELEDGDTVGPFTVLHLPGHTSGCAAYHDKKAGIMFCGDVLFKNGIGRTDLPGGDWNAMKTSLERLFALDGSIRAYPGHGPATTIGAEAVHYL